MSLNESQVRRYSRHILLPDVGGRGQMRLLDGAVCVPVGTGRYAELVALTYLAAAGVGTLVVAGDAQGCPGADEVSAGMVFAAGDTKRSRVDGIRERLVAINPDVTVTTDDHARALTLDPVHASTLDDALIAGGLAASRALAQLIDGVA